MRIPWTIAGLPELQSLSPDERARLLASTGAPSAVRLWSRNFFLGLFVTVVLLFILHLNDTSQRLAGPIGAAAVVVMTFGFTYLSHVWIITRIRGQVRMGIESSSGGDLVPVCIACGYDCTSTDADRCPECGTSRRRGGATPEQAS